MCICGHCVFVARFSSLADLEFQDTYCAYLQGIVPFSRLPGVCLIKCCILLITISLSHYLRYDPSTGIYGMDFYVVLERAGYRVARRRRCKSRVGIQHRVTKEDAMKWFQVKYEGVILNKAQANT